MSGLIVNSSTACIPFGNDRLLVYFQDNKGYVRESQWDGKWTGGTSRNRLFRAKPNTPLSAITWGSGSHIRVYYIDMNNILQEHCWDELWHTGQLGGKKITVDCRSKVAACSWTDMPRIRVYYQAPYEHRIKEVCWNGHGWETGTTMAVPAMLGSGLAAVGWGEGVRLAVYYQNAANHMVQENHYDGGWKAGGTLGEAISGTAITALTCPSDPKVRVYFEYTNGKIAEKGLGIDTQTSMLSQHITNSLTGTTLSACWVPNPNIRIRIYLQTQVHSLEELRGGDIGVWQTGEAIPIPE